MSKAVAPKEWPTLPEGTTHWARSTRRAGGMYHAHEYGVTACRSIRLNRHHSEEPRHLGDMQYWGVCPRCYKKGKNDDTTNANNSGTTNTTKARAD